MENHRMRRIVPHHFSLLGEIDITPPSSLRDDFRVPGRATQTAAHASPTLAPSGRRGIERCGNHCPEPREPFAMARGHYQDAQCGVNSTDGVRNHAYMDNQRKLPDGASFNPLCNFIRL